VAEQLKVGFISNPRPRKALLELAVTLGFALTCGGLYYWARRAEAPDGEKIFARNCAPCHHVGGTNGAPSPDNLRRMTRTDILRTLQSGPMKPEGARLTLPQQEAVALYLGSAQTAEPTSIEAACKSDPDPPSPASDWDGWGIDLSNTRFQPQAAAGLTAAQVPHLKLKWAFGFPGAWATYGQPTAFAGRIYEGSENGTVYSLDAQTGCVYWTFKVADTVKTAVAIDPRGKIAFLGDTGGNVYALGAFDGTLRWKTHVEEHAAARITGSPVLVNDRLYVPVSSGEEGSAVDPQYPCCTFRGSVVAIDSWTGKIAWQAYTIPDQPMPTGRKNSAGTALWGPSGAAVWSPPTIDLDRHAIYVATGNGYSDPPTLYSDAIVAFDLGSGKMLWSHQLNSTDIWNSSCFSPDKTNCPQPPGDDYDFGSPPILKRLPDGRALLLAGQKSGMVYALDPDHAGALVWQKRIAQGGPLGGIQWGGAVDDSRVFYPRSDWEDSKPLAGGGLFALDLATGRSVWSQSPPRPACAKETGCSAAQMAPVTAIAGVVFEGSLGGHLRAYDAKNGRVIWDFDTDKPFQTLNKTQARGGSMVATGPLIVGGLLYINSGYSNALAGNVLLAFSVAGK
jgi:polyvinyl alcohol dehydrogenase (cytochrome)